MLRKRARTRSVRKTDLHPLVRCDEGMKGLRPVETWERESLRATWRRAGYGTNWVVYFPPLFLHALSDDASCRPLCFLLI